MCLYVSGHKPLDYLRRYCGFEDLTSLLPSPIGASSKSIDKPLKNGLH
jgi:hypothetical protein